MILRPYQLELACDVLSSFENVARTIVAVLPTGGGKCLGKGTPVMMHDGSIRPVESIVEGDCLMGPDSLPRKVTATTQGYSELYTVTPVKGSPYVVNGSHILSLRMTGSSGTVKVREERYGAGDVVNISVRDYLNTTKNFKHCAKGWRAGVTFPEVGDLEIPPYILGVWLGDGAARSPRVTNPDSEIETELRNYADSLGLQVRDTSGKAPCPDWSVSARGRGTRNPNLFMDMLRKLNLICNKHIPKKYLTNSRHNQLELLAGLLDTDGHLHHSGYDFISVIEDLADGVCFLARSLGLAAYKAPCRKRCTNTNVWGDYFRVYVSGDTDIIPCRVERKKAAPRRQKKNPLNVGIRVEASGMGEYYGFELAGDGLFLLGDFTVTHNSAIASYLTTHTEGNVWVIAHRQELIWQMSETLKRFGVHHGIVKSGEKFEPRHHTQVASIQTLVRRHHLLPEPTMILVDECHHALSNSYRKVIDAYPKARILGVTATPCRLNGQGLGEVFEHMILGPTNSWLTEQGFLSPAEYYAPPMVADTSYLPVRAGDYAKKEVAQAMDKPTVTGDAVEHYRRICDGVPMLVFCTSVAHAEHVAQQYIDAGYRAASVDGTMPDAERKDRLDGLGTGKYQVITSCDLIGEGLDVPVVTAAQLLRPTASLGLFLQQIGRVLRPAEGKTCSYILDHVGNVRKHGFASTEHRWSLAGTVKKRGKQEASLRTCERCFLAHEPLPVCPHCGFEYPVKARGLTKMETIDGKLVKIEETKEERAADLRDAHSIPELIAFAKSRGYKKPAFWARKVYHGRSYVNRMPKL